MAENESITLPDGRTLSYSAFGFPIRPDDPIAFYFHGFPGTHVEGRVFAEAASKQDITVIAITRPGYGGSSYQPSRTYLDWPKDVLALADHLHIQRFAVIGLSGGGPYVLACIRGILPTRLLGAVVVSGAWPMKLGTKGMMLGNWATFNLAYYSTILAGWLLDWAYGKKARDLAHPERLEQSMRKGYKNWPVMDQAAAEADNGKLMAMYIQSVREAFRAGPQGAAWEAWLLGSEWGFELEELEVDRGRLVFWHGGRDINCPIAMAEKAATMIKGADLRTYRDEAHLSLSKNKMDEIVGSLKDVLKNY